MYSVWFQPVGFVTFHTRAGAEAAKQDLQVIARFSEVSREKKPGKLDETRELPGAPLQLDRLYISIYIHTRTNMARSLFSYFLLSFPFFLSFLIRVTFLYTKLHPALEPSWHGLMLRSNLYLSITTHTYTLSPFLYVSSICCGKSVQGYTRISLYSIWSGSDSWTKEYLNWRFISIKRIY